MTLNIRSPGNLWKLLLLALVLHSVVYVGIYAHNAATEHSQYGGDYMALWRRAELVAHGGNATDVYDTSQLEKFISHQIIIDQGRLYGFGYPPTFLTILFPFGYIDYLHSLLEWLLCTGMLYVMAVFTSQEWKNLKAVSSPAVNALLALFVIASPFSLYNVIVGQSSFLMAALLIIGLNCLPRYPILSGIAFGLLSVKPQLALMLPVLVVSRAEWKCLASAIVTIALLALATTLWLGMDSWNHYLDYMPVYMHALAFHPEEMMSLNASLYQVLLAWGIDKYLAMAVQVSFALFGAWSVWAACRMGASVGLRNSIVVIATFMAAPYIMIYDMTLCIIPVLFLLQYTLQGKERDGESLALIMLLVAPIIAHIEPAAPLVFLCILYFHRILLKRFFDAE